MHEHPLALLAIEDNPGDLKLLQRHLVDAGFGSAFIATVTSMAEAREAMEVCRFDVIITDLGLPDSSGDETAHSVIECADGAAVIVLTGKNEGELARRALRCGAQDYLRKGQFDPSDLERIVRYAVERQHLQNEYQVAIEKLRIVTRDFAEFTDLVSDDLRDPLLTIAGHTELAQRSSDDGDRLAVQRALKVIRRAQRHAGRTVDGLTTITDVARREYRRDLVNLARVVRDIDVDFAPQVEALGGQFEVLGAYPFVIGDQIWIRRVIEGLVRNAVAHGLDGRDPVVQIGAITVGPLIQIFVADNGHGIQPCQHAAVFRPFARGTADEATEGSGIGLSVCRRIVEAHDGRIWIESEPGRGTTVYFTLPSASADDVAEFRQHEGSLAAAEPAA